MMILTFVIIAVVIGFVGYLMFGRDTEEVTPAPVVSPAPVSNTNPENDAKDEASVETNSNVRKVSPP